MILNALNKRYKDLYGRKALRLRRLQADMEGKAGWGGA